MIFAYISDIFISKRGEYYVFFTKQNNSDNNKKHSLVLINKGDFRKDCGMQKFHAQAPLILVFVSDMAAIGKTAEQQALYAGNHSGSASQNVYLYAASKGLSTVICGSIKKDLLKKILKLKGAQEAVFSQPIGFSAL